MAAKMGAMFCCMVVGSSAAYELVSTPFGLRPAGCVQTAPEGAIITENPEGNSFIVHVPHKDLKYAVDVPPECDAFEAERLQAEEEQARATSDKNVKNIPDGWISNAGVYYMEDQHQLHITKFTSQWNVPPAPVSPMKPETVYYFIGLEDRTQGAYTSIHQPVLTWGDETEGGVGGWSLWSWTCCPKNVTWHSEALTGFKPGDTIFGSIEQTDPITWRIDSAFQNSQDHTWQNTTLTSQVGDFIYNYADVTLEVYNITSCNQMAEGNVAFTALNLTLSDNSHWQPPNWYIDGFASDCKTVVSIKSATEIDIAVSG